MTLRMSCFLLEIGCVPMQKLADQEYAPVSNSINQQVLFRMDIDCIIDPTVSHDLLKVTEIIISPVNQVSNHSNLINRANKEG